MNEITMKARAKINIALDIIGKRTDGYHEIRTIMQTVDLHDKITLKQTDNDKITLITNSNKIPSDSSNLAYKAAEYIKKNYSFKNGLEIKIEKNIPVAAGLAGGSTDCAAVLLGVRKLFNISLSDKKILEIASSMGADVAYCLTGGTCLAEGIGEKISKIHPFSKMFVVIAKPDIDVSTEWVYKNFDLSVVEKSPDIEKMKIDIEKNNINGICGNLCNVLETVTIREYPIIDDIKRTMLEFGASGALMSGSGPSVFGLYTQKEDCVNTVSCINERFKNVECHITFISNF